MVVDFDHFVHRSLDEFAAPNEFARMKPHATLQIKTEVSGWRFPLCEEYERCNRTLRGRKEFYNDMRPAAKELAKLDYSTRAECNRLMRIENPHLSNEELDDLLLKLDNPDSILKVDKFTLTDTDPNANGGEPLQAIASP